ncbi:hypothetical protein NQK81_13470 [Amycolatopsis roodepoortensis]|uniref:hypothetical protein n=1 Tax=Amycolatopsis roodepoortensis TaxID=700274 RepID=UPI00214C8541|nr:hypothetical protein [Amycolatopsis roodepoortensis]UUV34415.1 hypothetical protein NQK81_13470 [Amycolatopsis roodepoortensis]
MTAPTTTTTTVPAIAKRLYRAAVALFVLAIAHGVVAFVQDWTSPLVIVHMSTAFGVGFVGLYFECRARRAEAPPPKSRFEVHDLYLAELDDLDRRLRDGGDDDPTEEGPADGQTED